MFRRLYRDFAEQNPKWNEIPSSAGDIYEWDEKSDYIHEPPFFQNFAMEAGPDRRDPRRAAARNFRRLGHDRSHFSGGRDQADLAAGQYLDVARNSARVDFNSYGSRRGNDLVMTRGTFANVRIKNLMVPGVEGGVTKYFGPTGPASKMSIFDAAMRYAGSRMSPLSFSPARNTAPAQSAIGRRRARACSA